MVREALRRSDGKGLLGITNPAMDSVDCGANGLPLYYAYQYTGDRAYWAALQRLADWLEFSAPRGASGQLYHNPGSRKNDDRRNLSHSSAFSGGRKGRVRGSAGGCCFTGGIDDSKLGFTANFGMRTGTALPPGALGGGQGWMAGALALACRLLPPEDGETKKTLGERLNRLLKAMKNYLREDGRFHDVLDDPSTFPEVTASLMMCYTVYQGISALVVPAEEKRDADRVLELLERYVDEQGFVNSACASPGFDRPGNSAEAQAFYLLAHSAKRALEPQKA